MSWFLKSVLYATLLAWPGHLLAPAYQSALLALTGFLVGIQLSPPADRSVDLSAVNVLTIYVALCLGSDFTAWHRRWRAAALGTAFLVAIELATGAFALELGRVSFATGPPPMWANALDQALELPRWLAVPLIWIALVGRKLLTTGSNVIAVRSSGQLDRLGELAPRERNRRLHGSPSRTPR